MKWADKSYLFNPPLPPPCHSCQNGNHLLHCTITYNGWSKLLETEFCVENLETVSKWQPCRVFCNIFWCHISRELGSWLTQVCFSCSSIVTWMCWRSSVVWYPSKLRIASNPTLPCGCLNFVLVYVFCNGLHGTKSFPFRSPVFVVSCFKSF